MNNFPAGGGSALADIETMNITYTGFKKDEIVTMSGVQYRLLTLVSSGELALAKPVFADIWICGGGSNGGSGTSEILSMLFGGAGAYCATELNQNISDLMITIGEANTASGTIISGDVNLMAAGVANNINGGTGGGSTDTSIVGTGDGISKIPFEENEYFQPHCAGGGSGGFRRPRVDPRSGGNGGSNGGNGSAGNATNNNGGTGGNYGGGSGGNGISENILINGGNATFFGSGGGGGGYCYDLDDNIWCGSGGSGYQGVCYIRIPIIQPTN